MLKKILAAALLVGLVQLALPAGVQADEDGLRGTIKHVLLISVDGLHALDVANYVEVHPHSALAELTKHGITYSNARTPVNSDSFPGLIALITGGSPNSSGLFYDVSYNRSIFAPDNTNCSGEPGNTQVFDESIDKYVGLVSQDVIDPAKLPRFIDEDHKCSPKFPHDAMRTNTIFEVVRSRGARTAWTDKHPAYDLVNGPSGHGVQDLYTPEITNAPDGAFDATVSVICTAMNDELKVRAILREIHGSTHDGKAHVGAPAVFGMNFQAVSVGQKLSLDNNASPACSGDPLTGQPGGYKDGSGTPTKVLAYALEKTDEALRDMINALKDEHLYDSTLFIVTAKHGQSPIDPLQTHKVGHFADLVAALPDANTSEAAKAIADAAACTSGPCGFVADDDVALIWLGEDALELDHDLANEVARYLNKNAAALSIEEVIAGDELELKFNNPAHDPATPDVIVQPIYGTIYTGASKNKIAEHGGFSFGDTNVGLIVSNPHIDSRTVKSPVATSQVAASILKALEIDPDELQAVRKEGTRVLPFLFGDSDSK